MTGHTEEERECTVSFLLRGSALFVGSYGRRTDHPLQGVEDGMGDGVDPCQHEDGSRLRR